MEKHVLVTIRIPAEATGIRYVCRSDDGFDAETDVKLGMIVRVDQEEKEGGRDHE